MDEWLKLHLACPRDGSELTLDSESIRCADGHEYPVFDGIPVFLLREEDSTHGYIDETFRIISGEEEVKKDVDHVSSESLVDEFVQNEIPYTSGNLYLSLQNRLSRYPIPESRLEPVDREFVLDIGCNWGRWSIAAAKKGYRPVGIDPSLRAVLAARRVASQLGIEARFIVGDARKLPFKDESFDRVFSYGVYQHLSKENVRRCLREAARVLKQDGTALVQMPNKKGVRSYQQRRRRGFSEGEGFEVRYWSPGELREAFSSVFGPTEISADCYFGLGIQASDVDMLPFRHRVVVYLSEILKKMSGVIPPLTTVADSVYVRSVKVDSKE